MQVVLKLRCALMISGAVLLLPVVAQAQTLPPPPPPLNDGQTSPARPDGGTSVEDIVVTAQRRSESAQRSSVPISVLTSEAISRQGITQPQDLNTITPGLQLGMAGVIAQPYIRGAGNADNTGLQVSGIAFNVDGFYIAQPNAYGVSLFDIDRIEVLKGPQGTLYGRNATGGVINLVTQQPTQTPGGYIDVDANNYGLARLAGAINVPISDDLAVRGSFYVDRRDGYFRDGTGDDKSEAARIRVKATPATDVTLLVNLEYSHVGGKGTGTALNFGDSYNLPDPREGAFGPISRATNLAVDTTTPQSLDQKAYSASAELDWNLGNFTFTFLPQYRSVDLELNDFGNGIRVDTQYIRFRETTLETRLAYEANRLKIVGGAYYFYQHQESSYDLDAQKFFGFFVQSRLSDLNSESWAVFGQGTYELTDKLRLIGGLRYSTDDQNAVGTQANLFSPPGGFVLTPSISNDSTDYRVGAEYDIAEHSMVFATIASGYHSGGVLPSAAGPFGTNTYEPERLTAYELGSRNQFFDRTLQVNLEAFYWTYTNKQETFTAISGIGLPDNITRNASEATIKGADLDIVWRATRDDRFNFSVEYLDATYGKFQYVGLAPGPTACVNTDAGFAGPFHLSNVDCSNLPLARSPKWSGNFGYSHTIQLARGGTVELSGTGNFGSGRWLAATFASNMYAPSYIQGNVFLTYTAPSERWSINAYVRNVSNEVVATTAYPSSGSPNTTSYLSLNPPRTYGAQYHVNF